MTDCAVRRRTSQELEAFGHLQEPAHWSGAAGCMASILARALPTPDPAGSGELPGRRGDLVGRNNDVFGGMALEWLRNRIRGNTWEHQILRHISEHWRDRHLARSGIGGCSGFGGRNAQLLSDRQ